MRISINRGDPGFRPGILSGQPRERYDVFLDGVRLGAVVTADEDEGLVRVLIQDDDGWRHQAGELVHEEMRGEVAIVTLGARVLPNGWVVSVVHETGGHAYSIAAWPAADSVIQRSAERRWFHEGGAITVYEAVEVRTALAAIEAAPPPDAS
ncbi:hypothetical protein [Methylobacterium haplocladii]|uniref:Uncharacterized protein n=1 Tax=Methylobacterium haplocladii TaxID=1176176 RepID=A0A512ISH5_9HYPH|nr:hypothetical protein [Methylobacterium haplocladii]GEP00650.1 hypothetical protein MHA02_30370 [Methylobacterium haplocladii]GJD85413.1 hypothetical protein HPGCJGGD_3302 [Methylobacterium haplocladii]GLS57798.1 hypothetical protein GCM10007887_04540 [Methylobacterium haplocladii]